MHCLHNTDCSLQYAILLVMIGSSISEHRQKQTLSTTRRNLAFSALQCIAELVKERGLLRKGTRIIRPSDAAEKIQALEHTEFSLRSWSQ